MHVLVTTHSARAAGAWIGVLALATLLTGCGPPAPQAATWGLSAQAQRGRLLMAQYQCGSCHAIPDVAAARGQMGPPLDGFGRSSYIAGHVPNSLESLTRWIVEPAALVPGTSMPSMGVSRDDAHHMATFLHALR